MGASFANAFVWAPAGEVTVEAVASAIRASILADPGTTETISHASDRTIVIAALPRSSWIGIFDQLADEQHDDPLEFLASVSTELRRPVVATACFDSDVVGAWVIDGDVIDQVARPSAFVEEMFDNPDGMEGDADAWASRIEGVDAEELRQAWETEDVFAETRLAAAAEVLGIPAVWATSGLRSLAHQDDVGSLTTLRFRVERSDDDDVEPLGFGPSPGDDRSPPGQWPPTDGSPMPVLLEPGDKFAPSVLGWVTIDGALQVIIAGSAQTDGLVTVDRLRVEMDVLGPSGVSHVNIDVDIGDGRIEDMPVRLAVIERAARSAPPGRLGNGIRIGLNGRAKKVGQALLDVTVGTQERFEERQQTVTFEVTVREPHRTRTRAARSAS
jgi:hypothetical protein